VLRHLGESVCQIVLQARGRWRGPAGVERRDLAGRGAIDQGKRIAAQPRLIRLHDTEHRGGGDRRVDGIAAAKHHPDPRQGRQGMAAGYHGVSREHG